MQEFTVGKFYQFAVQGINEVNGQKFIFLSDGQIHTYRVKAFDFQTEWEPSEVPEKLNCYVKSIDIYGRPSLLQARKDVLDSCYTDIDTEYAFKVLAHETDPVTEKHFLKLKDPYGLDHRYYPEIGEPKRDVADIFSLIFKGVEAGNGNKAHLKLEYQAAEGEKEKTTVQPEPPVDEDVVADVEPEINFGVENDEREFKSTIVFPGGTTGPDIDGQMKIIVQTIAGFQNKNGGELYIGVNDTGNVCGINYDYPYLNSSSEDTNIYQLNTDGYELKIRNAVKRALGNTSNANLTFEFKKEGALDYCIIHIATVLKPVFVYGTRLFQRAGNMTQMLRGDEISWFIEERFQQRNQGIIPSSATKHENIETNLEEEETVVSNTGTIETGEPAGNESKPVQKVWYYITFYNDGGWSFQKEPVTTDEVVSELPIMTCFKNEPLMMAYENGCVNAVIPNDLINPKPRKGPRKLRKVGHRYQNGWNSDSKLLSVFSVRKDDLVAIRSVNESGEEYYKIHNTKAISIHGTPHLAGNMLVNPKFNAKPLLVKPLSMNTYPLISSLILKDYQKSGYLGIRSTDKNYQHTIKSLKKLLESDYE